ncbi:MAG: aldo/keto reductase, partial [Erysipelotrichaceae bacterium]|nr:aldo/keto reductase [Erysipelotrichaceae bacterium]
HDKPEVLEKILQTYPEVEIVQIQLNYLDYDSVNVQSRRCLEVCEKYDKPVIVMEPVRGGRLAQLPPQAEAILNELQAGSPASFAIRFAAGFDQVRMVLSGVSSLAQMEDNMSFMKEFRPLDEKEMAAVWQVRDVLNAMHAIGCTSCRYCVDENHCPMEIPIPELFANFNNKKALPQSSTANMYYEVLTRDRGKASDCIQCGQCESVCPQHLEIRNLLKEVSAEFES